MDFAKQQLSNDVMEYYTYKYFNQMMAKTLCHYITPIHILIIWVLSSHLVAQRLNSSRLNPSYYLGLFTQYVV